MLTTMSEAAALLGIPKQRLHENIKRGVVTTEKAGRIVLVDPERARLELEACGFFRRSATRKRKKPSRIS